MCMKHELLCVILPILLCELCAASTCKAKCSNQSSYAEAYLFLRSVECVSSMQNHIKDYRDTVASVVACSNKCPGVLPANEAELLRAYAVSERHACRSRCQRKLFDVPDVPDQMIEFRDEISYNSLRRCKPEGGFFDIGKNKEASMSQRAYSRNSPDDILLRDAHNTAMSYDSNGNHTAICEHVEETVSSLFIALEECQRICEDHMLPSEPGKKFLLPFTRYAVSELECKTRCLTRLLHLNGTHNPRLLSEAYENLQVCYYYSSRLEDACWTMQSFMSLHPEDPDVLMNQVFNAQRPSIQNEWLFLRKVVLQYLEPLEKERKQLVKLRETLQTQLSQARANLGRTELWKGISVTRDSAQLNGTARFEAEGFATQEECSMLFQMGHNFSVKGDGYNGKEFPMTKYELFKGLSPSGAAKLVENNQVKPDAPRLMLRLAERVRAYVEAYFELEPELYYSYTHLACRETLPGSPETRDDMSHAVHGDNCNYNLETGECIKKKPAYIWRDYSAVLYLNDDFDGGEFIFGRSKDDIDATIVPRCGRVVGFSGDSLHGVLALKKGERCVLALWFTFDPNHRENGLTEAAQVIHRHQQDESLEHS